MSGLNSEVFTWRYYWNTVRRCKLYDFAKHVWMDFDGRITSAPVVDLALDAPGGRRRSASPLERCGVMAQMIRHEGLDEVVAVIVARLHA